jgi:Phage tail lysozyme
VPALTDQLPTVGSGKGIIDPGARHGGFIGGLADLASKGLNAYVQSSGQQDKIDSGNARNAVEQAVFDRLTEANQALQGGGRTESVDTTLQSVWGEVPREAVAAANALSSTQTAVNQGRSSSTALDLGLERTIADLYHKFPEQKDTIATYLKGRGFDHYLFREVELNLQASAQEGADAITRQTYYRDVATHAGLAAPGMSDDAIIQAGQEWANGQAQLKLAQDKLDMTIKSKTLSDSERKTAMSEGYQATANQLILNSTTKFGTIVQSVSSLYNAMADSPTALQDLSNVRPQIVAGFESYRQSLTAQMAAANLPVEQQNAVLADLDRKQKSLDSVFDANFKVNTQTVTSMQNTFKLNAAQAFPLYSQLATAFGQSAVNEMFGGNPMTAISPEMQAAIAKELTGVTDFNSTSGSVHINNAVQLLKGQKNLGDLTPAEAKAVFPSIAATVVGNGNAIVTGKPADSQAFINGWSQVTNAALELQPGTTGLHDLHTATGLNSNPTNVAAITKLIGDPATKPQATALLTASRNTAVSLFLTAQGTGRDVGANYQKLVYDNKSGKYSVVWDQQAYNKDLVANPLNNRGGGSSIYPESAYKNKPIDPALKSKMDVLNTNLDFYANTQKLDPNAPQGATPLSLRNNLVNGVPLTTATGKPVLDPKENLRTQLDAFKTEVQQLPNEIATDPSTNLASFKGASISPGDAVSRLTSRGIPKVVASGIVGNLITESGLNVGAVGDSGKAASLAQWHPDRQKEAKAQGYDLSNPGDALDFILHELNTTEGVAKKKLQGAKTPQEAADIFALYFLRPQGASTGIADNVLHIDKRRSNAIQVYASG